MAKEKGSIDPPAPSCGIAVKEPCPFAGGDEDHHAGLLGFAWGFLCASDGPLLAGCRFLELARHQVLLVPVMPPRPSRTRLPLERLRVLSQGKLCRRACSKHPRAARGSGTSPRPASSFPCISSGLGC